MFYGNDALAMINARKLVSMLRASMTLDDYTSAMRARRAARARIMVGKKLADVVSVPTW